LASETRNHFLWNILQFTVIPTTGSIALDSRTSTFQIKWSCNQIWTISSAIFGAVTAESTEFLALCNRTFFEHIDWLNHISTSFAISKFTLNKSLCLRIYKWLFNNELKILSPLKPQMFWIDCKISAIISLKHIFPKHL
jgi:hypothetical protein